MHVNTCLVCSKPILSVTIPLGMAGNDVNFMASGNHSTCHLIRASATGHFWSIEVLVQIDYFHKDAL